MRGRRVSNPLRNFKKNRHSAASASSRKRTRTTVSLPHHHPLGMLLLIVTFFIMSIIVRASAFGRLGQRWTVVPGFVSNNRRDIEKRTLPQIMVTRLLLSSRSSSSSNNNSKTPTPPDLNFASHHVEKDDIELYQNSGYKAPSVNWYPGHIAKAERQLAETLKAVDVVVEVRDARACRATSHPRVAEWCAGRPRIVVLTHSDQIPKLSQSSWKRSYQQFGAEQWDGHVSAQIQNQATQAKQEQEKIQQKKNNNNNAVSPVSNVLFVNAKQGQGIYGLTKQIYKAGSHVQQRRQRRGLKERPLRVGMIGFPNVGKSALINKVLGRKRAKTANTPGITRTLQWIRVRTSSQNKKGEFELLDSPGIIPAHMVDQDSAMMLAAINCIGQAAYDNQAVASYLCERLKTLVLMGKADVACPLWQSKCVERYGFDPILPEEGVYLTGEDMLFKVADGTCRGSPEDASRKILQDFRTGRMGPIALQLAPISKTQDGQVEVKVQRGTAAQRGIVNNEQLQQEEQEEQRLERARVAVERAKQEGLELPPVVASNKEEEENEEVGKGLFDGW